MVRLRDGAVLALRRLGQTALWRLSRAHSQQLHGLDVRVASKEPGHEPEEYLGRVSEALGLLSSGLPRWMERGRSCVSGIIISPAYLGAAGWFSTSDRRCWLHPRYVLAPDIEHTFVACTILHEFVHAWIHSKGIPYHNHRLRIEAICHRVAFAGAKELNAPPSVVRTMSSYLADVGALHSRESRLQHWIAEAERRSTARWIKPLFDLRVRQAKRELQRLSSETLRRD